MEITTSRFGPVEIESDDILHFPKGILGMEECRQWVLLADAQLDMLGWLQSIERPEIALAVVSPRRFVPDYRVRVSGRELAPLALGRVADAQVLVIVNKNQDYITLNLKAPLVIHLGRRLGCQIVAKDPHPLQYVLQDQTTRLRKSA
ncbi:MAG: flagellar assembly protein FliW [Pirellulales bacterium]